VLRECAIRLDKAFDTHILKRSLLSDDKWDLSKLHCEKQTTRTTKCIGDVKIWSQRERVIDDFNSLILDPIYIKISLYAS
jgi:hypothetical protein